MAKWLDEKGNVCIGDAPYGLASDCDLSPEIVEEVSTRMMIEGLTAIVQTNLDNIAKTRGYDNIVSACSYAAAPNPFQAEGQAFVTWRGAVWEACYAILAEVQAETRDIPTVSELLSELPSFTG